MAEYDYDVLVDRLRPGRLCRRDPRRAKLGLKTACAESRETLGGTCLNVGCIPSKAMLHASEYFEAAAGGAMGLLGVEVTPSLNLGTMHGQRLDAVKQLTGGIEFLFKKNKVTWLKGRAASTTRTPSTSPASPSPRRTWSSPPAPRSPAPRREVDNAKGVVVDSTGALELASVPRKLVVIGGGVMASSSAACGAASRRSDRGGIPRCNCSPAWTAKCARKPPSCSRSRAWSCACRPRSPASRSKARPRRSTLEPAAGGAGETLEADCVRVSIGRKPNTEGLGLDTIGLALNKRGQIETDHDFPHRGRRRLGDRRRDPRPDARAQGRGRGHRGRREHRRPDRHREPRGDPLGGLHDARDRRRRPDRGRRRKRPATRSRSASSRCSPTAAPRPTTSPTAS